MHYNDQMADRLKRKNDMKYEKLIKNKSVAKSFPMFLGNDWLSKEFNDLAETLKIDCCEYNISEDKVLWIIATGNPILNELVRDFLDVNEKLNKQGYMLKFEITHNQVLLYLFVTSQVLKKISCVDLLNDLVKKYNIKAKRGLPCNAACATLLHRNNFNINPKHEYEALYDFPGIIDSFDYNNLISEFKQIIAAI